MRQKSSLTRKRVKTDPLFAQTMLYANLLGRASKIASVFYKTLPTERKKKGLYKKLTGMVMQLLKENKQVDEITAQLQQLFSGEAEQEVIATTKHTVAYSFADALLEVLFAKPVSYSEPIDTVDERLKDYGFV